MSVTCCCSSSVFTLSALLAFEMTLTAWSLMIGEAPFGVFNVSMLLTEMFGRSFIPLPVWVCNNGSLRGCSPPPSFNSTLSLTDPANSGKVIPVAFGEEGK